jgi:hypothetical protein
MNYKIENRKLLFLDMDGVINCTFKISEEIVFKNESYAFDKILVNRINLLVNRFNLSIISSSSWRINLSLFDLKNVFNLIGLESNKLINITPNLKSLGGWNDSGEITRGQEIRNFLFSIDYIPKRCLILDDRQDAGAGLPKNCYFIQTNNKYGLTKKLNKKCEEILRF